MRKLIAEIIKASQATQEKLLNSELSNIEKAAQAIESSMMSGGKLILFGNGGSAADSQHIAAEFVGRFKLERKGLPALALTTNSSTITALANDYGYEVTFARQLEALAKENDVVIAISTSGNAKNVILAAKKAKENKIKTIALTGMGGGLLGPLCDISIVVPSSDTARIQESHILIGHIIAEIVDSSLSKK